MGYYDDLKKQQIAEQWRNRLNPNYQPTTILGHMDKQQEQRRTKTQVSRPLPPPLPPAQLNYPGQAKHATVNTGHKGRVSIHYRHQQPVNSAPWFPAIDRVFVRLSKIWYLVLLIVGAGCGLVYGNSMGLPTDKLIGDAILGALGGLLLIPLLQLATKIVIVMITLGVLAASLFFVYRALS